MDKELNTVDRLATKDKYNFRIIRTEEDLMLSGINNEKYISVECSCCKRQVIIPIEKYGMTCQERKEMKLENAIN